MKFKVTPLLDPQASPWVVDEGLPPRQFVDWLDQHKVLLLQRPDDEEDVSQQPQKPWTVQDFGQLVVDLQLQEYPYIGGAAPRTVIPVNAAPGKGIVFTANERCVRASESKRGVECLAPSSLHLMWLRFIISQ